MHYFPTVYIALFGWPLFMLLLTMVLPIRRVVLVAIIGGNLFLPQAGFVLPGIPNYTNMVAAGLSALLPALLVASPKLFAWRPRPIDLFFFAFLIAPGVSSLVNGLGEYDAVSVIVNRFLEWGVAYWVGRALLDGPEGLRDLALGIVIGGIVYAPLCVWEIVMSPGLHKDLYGFRSSSWRNVFRMGGYRPTVFMHSGLPVAAWMAASSLVCWMLWRSKSITRIGPIPMWMVAIGMVMVTIALRSTGAAILLVGLICAMEFVQVTRLRIALMATLLLPAGYIAVRVAGWDGHEMVEMTGIFGEERAGSLNMRLENDAIIVDRAMERPVFGWGGWGRWRVRDAWGNDITVSDSWWGILVGSTGVFGLVAAYGTFIAPSFLLIRRRMRGRLFEGANGAAWAVGMALLLFVLDTLSNAMPNSVYILAAGVLTSFVVRPRDEQALPVRPDEVASATSTGVGPKPTNRPPMIDLR